MQSQPIRPIPAGAAAALGGEPVMPPVMPGQAVVPVAAPVVQVAIGHPTFDPTPAEIQARRAKTDAARKRLAALALTIRGEAAALTPLLDELAPDAKLLLKSDAFDVAAAQGFVKAAAQLVAALAAGTPPAEA